MGLKRRGTGRRPVLNLTDRQDTSRRTWQTKYQQICADHMIKNGVRADSPLTGRDIKIRDDSQEKVVAVSSADPSVAAEKNPLAGLMGQYASDSEGESEELDTKKKNGNEEKKGGGLDAKVEDFMREIQALVPEAPKEEKFENASQEMEVSESDAWQQCYDHSSGYVYFWNVLTNEVSWEPPPGYDTEMLQSYGTIDASQAIGAAPMTADYGHIAAVTPESMVVGQQMIPGVPIPHGIHGVPSVSGYPMKAPYAMPQGMAHPHALMMQGYPVAPAQLNSRPQAFPQHKQRSTSKLKVPGLEDEEDEEDAYKPSSKLGATSQSHSTCDVRASNHPSDVSMRSGARKSLNDSDEGYDGKIEMITSFSQDSDEDEEHSSNSSVEKARPPPKRRKGSLTAIEIPKSTQTTLGPQLPVSSQSSISQQSASSITASIPANKDISLSNTIVPKVLHSSLPVVSSSSSHSGIEHAIHVGINSIEGKGKVLHDITASSHEPSKDVTFLTSSEVRTKDKVVEKVDTISNHKTDVQDEEKVIARSSGGRKEEGKPPPLSMIAGYGAEDSEDEEGEKQKEEKNFAKSSGADKTVKPLFPIKIEGDEEIMDTRAFRRKRRIQVESTSKAGINMDKTSSSGLGGENVGRTGSMAENMAKLANLWSSSDSDTREEGGERRGLGFGGVKHVMPEEVQSSKNQKRRSGLIAFIKAETINLPPPITEEDCEKRTDVDVEKLCQDLWDKVEFLQEGSKNKVSPVQEIAIQIQALRSAHTVGALSSNYFGTWLQERWATLERTEEGAAPPGWVVQWCRYGSPATTHPWMSFIYPFLHIYLSCHFPLPTILV